MQNIIRNKHITALLAVCLLLAVVVFPLIEQIMESTHPIYGIVDDNPEKTPEKEEHHDDAKYILNELMFQPLPVFKASFYSSYKASLLSYLDNIKVPPPKG